MFTVGSLRADCMSARGWLLDYTEHVCSASVCNSQFLNCSPHGGRAGYGVQPLSEIMLVFMPSNADSQSLCACASAVDPHVAQLTACPEHSAGWQTVMPALVWHVWRGSGATL